MEQARPSRLRSSSRRRTARHACGARRRPARARACRTGGRRCRREASCDGEQIGPAGLAQLEGGDGGARGTKRDGRAGRSIADGPVQAIVQLAPTDGVRELRTEIRHTAALPWRAAGAAGARIASGRDRVHTQSLKASAGRRLRAMRAGRVRSRQWRPSRPMSASTRGARSAEGPNQDQRAPILHGDPDDNARRPRC